MSRLPIDNIDPAYSDIADLLAAGRADECAKALQRAIDRDGPRPGLLQLLGCHLEGLGRFEHAYAAYKQAAAGSEPSADLWGRLSRCCLLLGRPHEANALARTLRDSLNQEALARCIVAAVSTWKGAWQDAQASLDIDCSALDPAWQIDAQCRRRLCDNVLALRTHQPETFAVLAGAKAPLHVRRVLEPSGIMGIDSFRDNQWVRILSLAPQAPHIPQDKQGLLQAFSLAFTSLTVWPLIAQCFRTRQPNLYLTQQQSFHVLEADPQVFYGLALLEDLRPCITAARVHWYLGADRVAHFCRTIEGDPQLLVPAVTIGSDAAIQQAIDVLSQDRSDATQRLTAEIQAYYRTLPPDHGRRVFSQTLGRPSRVYLLTTRFSTVLQFVTADMQRAFQRLGWDTRLGIEADDSRVYTEHAILKDLNDFKPDVLFILDHLRYEWLFRNFPELYHICWIQDQMANLYCTRAGESLGERDFVLVMGSGADLMHRYHYPRQRLVYMPFSTNLDMQGEAATVDISAYSIPDVAFATNHGRTPEATLPFVIEALGPNCPPEVQRIAHPYLQAVRGAYDTGNILYEDVHYRQLLQHTEADTGIRLPDEHSRIVLARAFRLHVGGAIHRQQVLRWLKDARVHFGLFGREWDCNPEFAPYARGVVTDSAVMNAVFRATPINLQISQYTNSHIRFWNGLAAGGFFLVRACPPDSGRPAAENVLALLRRNMGRTYADVLAAEPLSGWEDVLFRSHFEETIPGHTTIDEYAVDVFMMTLECPTWTEKMGNLADKIQFETREQCLAMIRRYLADPAARADIMARIRGVLQDQTYEANLRRALATIRDRIG